jgi:3-methyladenine DNA glycosylase/8-oxoguanine DNA glycosylase
MTSLKIPAPRFDWRRLIFAHGWVHLAPFHYDDQTHILSRPLRVTRSRSVMVSLPPPRRTSVPDLRASITNDAPLSASDKTLLKQQIQRMLRLEEDFSNFHNLCKSDPMLRFAARQRCGGLLRGPDAFEDVIKTVATTNCDWRNTKSMCEKLCALDRDGNFPGPGTILRFSERQLATKTKCGYRARTIRTVAKMFIEGKLPLDDWASRGEFERIRETLGEIWGIGPYALSHILVLLGDYRTIPVDSEIIKYLSRTHFNGRKITPKKAVEPYERYGDFRFLAFKFGRMARRENYIDWVKKNEKQN